MFAVVQYPLTDVRPFVETDTGRSLSPTFPVVFFPERKEQTPFVRGFGHVAPRSLGGLEEWPAEASYCNVSHALRLKQAFLKDHSLRRSRGCKAYCALRRLYWDGRAGKRGSVVGRIEVGFGIKSEKRGGAMALESGELDQVIDALLSQPAYLLSRSPPAPVAGDGTDRRYFDLLSAGEKLAMAYLRATTLSKRSSLVQTNSWWVKAGSPMLVMECNGAFDVESVPGRAQMLSVPQLNSSGLELYLYKRPFRGRLYPIWIIRYQGRTKDVSRRLRINLSRLHAEIGALKVVTDLVNKGRLNPSPDSQADKDFQAFLGQTVPYLTRDSFNGLPNFEFMAAALTVIDAPLPGELGTLRNVINNLRPNLHAQLRRFSSKMARAVERWDFFIAHAGADQAPAEQLYEKLSPQSRVFLDSKTLLPGDDWDVVLPEAQADSLVTVVLISSNTTGAHYERAEIARAIQMARSEGEEHRVVPVYLSDEAGQAVPIPYGLETKHSITLARGEDVSGLAQRLLDLLAKIKSPASPS